MLTYFKNLFRKKFGAREIAEAPNIAVRPTAPASDASVPLPRVETASLQLLAILAKFPDDIRQFVVKLPPPEAMVALPLPTILKFLPSGSVKMSLASVVRQAPPGTFAPMPTIEKRGVEVPLAEIFKRVSPAILKKRDDQRYTELADDGFDIFGDDENPYALAPRVGESSPAFKPSPMPSSVMRPAPSSVVRPAQRVVQMPDSGMVAAPPPDVAVPLAPASGLKLTPEAAATPLPQPPPSQPPAPPAASDQPPLVLALNDLIANWPEPIKSEASALNGATVALPAAELSAGLAKGKVAFQWGQIRAWLTPPPTVPTEGNEATELSLPLRVVAPAFLKHSKKDEQPKKKLTIDDSIPPLFGDGREPAPVVPPTPEPPAPTAPEPAIAETAPVEPAAEAVAPTPEPPPAEAPASSVFTLKIKDDAPVVPESPIVPAAPAVEEAPATATKKGTQKGGKKAPEPKATDTPQAVAVETPAPEPVVATPAPTAAAKQPAQSLSELFNEPAKTSWSPTELIAAMLATLPTVDGAVVALQEGLVVAHQLPEGFKGDVFAAFLPQMFARLNQYSGEMKLGTVNDLVLNADGRQCQLFRVGQLFFGVLAKPNETLPWHELRLCANALAE